MLLGLTKILLPLFFEFIVNRAFDGVFINLDTAYFSFQCFTQKLVELFVFHLYSLKVPIH